MKGPDYEKIPFNRDRFFAMFEYLTREEERHVLLESGRTGRYSVAGIRPFAVISSRWEQTEIIEQGRRINVERKDPLEVLAEFMQSRRFEPVLGIPDFQGGAIGYISYDYAHFIERLPNEADDDLKMPILHFLVFDEWAIFDHEEDCLWLMALAPDGKERVARMKAEWMQPIEEEIRRELTPPANAGSAGVSFTEAGFVEAVEKVQEYIAAGDVFQVNLSVRQSKQLSVPAFDVYKELRSLNPSPYMGYLHDPDFQIVSGSPELLVKKAGTRVETRPIAGTRPRGADEAEDRRYAEELIGNEKELAEHIMLVDLERNDLGKVCRFGSVNVDELMTIEKYSHVMHIVSNITGELEKEKSPYELVRAVFPGGTITGAPKVRTLEIIEELEPVKRGVYTGSLGWIGFNEDVNLNIAIRTMVVKDGLCHVQAGAGIVIDSNPAAEYKESLGKAAALWKAKEAAEKGVPAR